MTVMGRHHVDAAVLSLAAVLVTGAVATAQSLGSVNSSAVTRPAPATTPTPVAATEMKTNRRAQAAARAAEYAEMIDAVAATNGVSPDLVRAVILGQSAYDPRAVSPRGARGLMPLMPATAKVLGVADVLDPRQNIPAGVRHLRAMLDRFDNDVPLALTAYSAGEVTATKYGANVPDPAVRGYVIRVLKAYEGLRAERRLLELASAGKVNPVQPVVPRGQRSELWRYTEDERTVVYTNIERPGSSAP
jgi:soluble lytic murein transglycosylase-like protein